MNSLSEDLKFEMMKCEIFSGSIEVKSFMFCFRRCLMRDKA